MRNLAKAICCSLIFSILTLAFISCKKKENPVRFPNGTFPDSAFALADLNSSADDYNDLNTIIESTDFLNYKLYGEIPVVFTSNRSGANSDLIQGNITFVFDQTDGSFGVGSELTSDAFLTKLLNEANTPGNELGAYRLFSTDDGYEFLVLSSDYASGNQDIYFLKNLPYTGSNNPPVIGPTAATLLNTSSNDAYFCFDTNKDTAYLSSDSGGNFDIYFKKKPADTSLDTWLTGPFNAPVKVDSINSSFDEKCPFIFRRIMVFASDRPGGLGGYDLYYSVFKNGKWNSPVNMGPGINTSADEVRPIIGMPDEFLNQILVFSSNRPGGKGGFDIYACGVTIK